jgi:hypothetical protein
MTRKPPGKHVVAGLDHATLRALVDALHVVAGLLDPAGARRHQERADPQPQRRRQRRTR